MTFAPTKQAIETLKLAVAATLVQRNHKLQETCK